jgi:hypothetical protein
VEGQERGQQVVVSWREVVVVGEGKDEIGEERVRIWVMVVEQRYEFSEQGELQFEKRGQHTAERLELVMQYWVLRQQLPVAFMSRPMTCRISVEYTISFDGG